MINHLMYADDLVILSPSAKGLQRLVNVLPMAIVMTFNLITLKTVRMYLPSKGNCTLNSPLELSTFVFSSEV